MKDTLGNVRDADQFTVNLATWRLADAVNATSAPLPRGVTEFEAACLTPLALATCRAPGVIDGPVVLECTSIHAARPCAPR